MSSLFIAPVAPNVFVWPRDPRERLESVFVATTIVSNPSEIISAHQEAGGVNGTTFYGIKGRIITIHPITPHTSSIQMETASGTIAKITMTHRLRGRFNSVLEGAILDGSEIVITNLQVKRGPVFFARDAATMLVFPVEEGFLVPASNYGEHSLFPAWVAPQHAPPAAAPAPTPSPSAAHGSTISTSAADTAADAAINMRAIEIIAAMMKNPQDPSMVAVMKCLAGDQ
jgi:hypothetical protein